MRSYKEAVKLLSSLVEEKTKKFDRFFVEEFCMKIKTAEEVKNIISDLEQVDEVEKHFEAIISKLEENIEAEKQKTRALDQKQRTEESKARKEWSMEEVSTLSKAIVKFPAGTPLRWKTIADYVGDRTVKDIIQKSQELSSKASLIQGVSAANAKKQEDTKKQDSPPKKKVSPKKKDSSPKQPPVDPNGWSDLQQRQMEQGMRKYGADLPAKERWVKIAGEVDDKAPKECFERFKEIREKLKTGK